MYSLLFEQIHIALVIFNPIGIDPKNFEVLHSLGLPGTIVIQV